ncbi:MAG: hypothetical protein ACPG4T_18865 [Nannocystaceae bacterium]
MSCENCIEEEPATTANDSSDPPTSTSGHETETVEPGTTDTTGPAATTSEATTGTSTGQGSDTEPETAGDTDSDGPMCNNGILEGDEECDDSDVGPDKPCLPGCILNVCGDGQLNPGIESCDEGDLNGVYGVMCSSECTVEGSEYCGDGELQPDLEDCEPGEIHEEFDVECEACFWSPYRIVFVTSLKFDGAMHNDQLPNNGKSGLALADLHCQQLADDAGLPGTYHAWLSDNNGTENHSDAADRIGGPGSTESFRMRNGGLVAQSWDALVADGPSKAILFTQWGVQIEDVTSRVWANTSKQGASLQDSDCSGWTGDTFFSLGSTGKTEPGEAWTNSGDNFPCDQLWHLYCFQGGE